MTDINNLKINITGVIPYKDIKEICDFLEPNYEILFVDNGNIVLTRKEKDGK